MWTQYITKRCNKTFLSFLRHQSKTVSNVKLSSSTTSSDLSKFNVGETFHGFEVKDIQKIDEFKLTALRLQHAKTKAEYLHLYRDDSNNVFSVCFRTTPMDSTGSPHILEHTVLCGSEMYPVRDPFFKMLNRSLATFMNAMTGPDYTFYPFSTQNEQDFRNLQKIYLDAVFKPNIRELDFMQEGWRLEHTDANNFDSKIVIKGVVYNEMKGAFAENENILCYKALNTLLPDHTYSVVSGGDPFIIPNLTWEELKQFHREHYHPSNAKFFSYGNFPLLPTLEYINSVYLSNLDVIDVEHTIVPSQGRWTEQKIIDVSCRYEPMGDPIEKQNTFSISILMSDITNVYDTFVLQFVTELLIRGPNSPFYKSLVEPKISGGFTPSTGFEAQTRDTIFTLGLQGIENSKFDEFLTIFDNTIDEVVLNGFEKRQIESVLHRYELLIKHQSTNFGLNILYGLIPTWNHDGDIIQALHVNSLIDQLKTSMENDPEYLQNFVKIFFQNNQHRVVSKMCPDKEYEKQYSVIEEEVLKNKTKNLSIEDQKYIYTKNLQLKEEQNAKQNTDILPTLQIEDIKDDVERIPIIKTISASVPTFLIKVNTNGIAYFHGILNTSDLTPEQNMLLPLFCHVINKLGTNQLNHLEFDTQCNMKTGGLSFNIHIGESLHALHTHEPGVELYSYCLDSNMEDMWELWQQLFEITELKDVKRFEMLVQLYMANLMHGLADNGHMYAMRAAAGLVSGSAYQKDLLSGLQHISYMKRLISTSNYEMMLSEISEIGRILFDKIKLRCSLNVSPENADTIKSSYDNFIKGLPGNALGQHQQTYVTPKIWYPEDAIQCHHHVLNVPVNFCARSVLTVPYVDSKHASLRVLARLLSAKYLHPELRERRGAYGGGARMTPDGILTFFSYRDPKNLETLDVFDGTAMWMKEELPKMTQQDILEAKLGVFQMVDAPVAPCNKGSLEFSRGLTPDILQRHRAEIMGTTMDDLMKVGEMYLGEKREVLEGKAIVGPQMKDTDTSKRKDELWTVMQND